MQGCNVQELPAWRSRPTERVSCRPRRLSHETPIVRNGSCLSRDRWYPDVAAGEEVSSSAGTLLIGRSSGRFDGRLYAPAYAGRDERHKLLIVVDPKTLLRCSRVQCVRPGRCGSRTARLPDRARRLSKAHCTSRCIWKRVAAGQIPPCAGIRSRGLQSR